MTNRERRLEQQRRDRRLHGLRTVGFVAGGVLILAAAAGSAYNSLAARRLRAAHPPPGKLYSVGGHVMHLYCTGAGSPVIVAEPGLGDDWLGWQRVQPQLASVTRICSYDRAGLGWSDPRPGPRDALAIAGELHDLLQRAGITGPLVLMAHSAGGLYAREYAAKHQQQIAGLVLVDATPPESFDQVPGARTTPEQWQKLKRQVLWSRLRIATGIQRLTGRCRGYPPRGLQAYRGWYDAEACRYSSIAAWMAEAEDFEKSGEKAAHTGPFGSLPILVISQDPDRPKAGWTDQEIAGNPIWASLQENLKSLSLRSRRIIARGSGHRVQIDRPDVIVAAVTRMVLEIRGGEPPATAYGSTIVQ